MATAANIPLFNTDPNVQAQAALLQQRQALAQALMGQGLTPVDTSNRSIGGVAYPVSPMEGLAKMLQTYSGMKMSRDTIGQQAALAAQAYGNLLQKYQPGSPTYSPDQINQAEAGSLPADGMGPPDPRMMAAALSGQSPANQNVNPNNPQGIPAQILASHDAGMTNDEAFKVLTAPYAPTDATKAATQGGMNPVAANQQAFAKGMSDPNVWAMRQVGLDPQFISNAVAGKAQKDATLQGRPEQSLYTFGQGGPQLQAVSPDPGNNMQFSVNGGQVSASPIAGSVPSKSQMVGGTAGASAAATAPHQIIELWDPAQQRTVKVYAGNILPPAPGPGAPQAAASQGQGGIAGMREAVAAQNDPAAVDREIAKSTQDLAKVADPASKQMLQSHIDDLKRQKLAYSSAPSSASLGETDQMKAMTTRFENLRAQNSEAQNTISYLQSIKEQGAKAATGQFSDRLQFVNSLLAPFSEKAYDAATATQLLTKYSNQIVARLGQGGLGTDAARAILQAAYPNAHMTTAAINDAADNLIGAQQMTQAKTALLAPLHNSRNAAAYQQTEQKFDQLADPRIWQIQAMDANTAKQFLSRLPRSEQESLRQRAIELHKMGAL